jgi:hypothetical protein
MVSDNLGQLPERTFRQERRAERPFGRDHRDFAG